MERLLVTIMTTGGTPARGAVLARATPPVSPVHARTHVGARGPQVSAPRGAESGAAASTASPEAALPRDPARSAIPAQRAAHAQTRMRPRAAAPGPHLTPRKRESGPGDPLGSARGSRGPVPPPHTAWLLRVSRPPGRSKDHAQGGAVPSGHTTRHHPAVVHTASHKTGLPVHHKNPALF